MECAALLFTCGTFAQCAASALNVPGIRMYVSAGFRIYPVPQPPGFHELFVPMSAVGVESWYDAAMLIFLSADYPLSGAVFASWTYLPPSTMLYRDSFPACADSSGWESSRSYRNYVGCLWRFVLTDAIAGADVGEYSAPLPALVHRCAVTGVIDHGAIGGNGWDGGERDFFRFWFPYPLVLASSRCSIPKTETYTNEPRLVGWHRPDDGTHVFDRKRSA
ncbi:hypothetical protein B0H13DRAFT_1884375 [Mycena leptocephala]|nr:hypothetical protein B0H13DRAFT_1884375 [Mycena leptocephala]